MALEKIAQVAALAAGVWMAVAAPGGLARAADVVPSEWTLEEARKCWKPMTRAVQHLGVPGYEFQAGVMWDGALVFGPLSFRELKVMQQEMAPLGDHLLHVTFGYGERMTLIDRQGTDDPRIRRGIEGGRLPVAHVETRDGDLAWSETVFAHLPGRSAEQWLDPKDDDLLVVHAVFKVRNTGYAKRTGHLWIHAGDTSQVRFGYKCEQLAEIGREVPCKLDGPYGRLAGGVRYVAPKPEKGELVAHADLAGAEGVRGKPRGVIEWRVPLGPGEEAALRLIVPYGVVPEPTAKKLAALDSQRQLAEVVEFWKRLQYGPGQINTPDPLVNDYLVAVAGQMAQQVAHRRRSTGVWMYKTSPNHYEGYWPCNAAKALPAFDLRGQSVLSRRVLKGFIDSQTDDVGGLDRASMGRGDALPGEGFAKTRGFLGNFGQWTANPLLLSHGMGLWALASHYRITRDDAWLGQGPGSPLAAMLDGFDWVAQQRRRTMREVGGKKVPHWGLLPAASAHDWLAGNTIFNDAFCIYGMAEVVRLLRETHHPRAEAMARELADYRQTLRDRYAEARDLARPLPLADGTTLPYVPRLVQELDWARPDWTYTGYGPLRAGAWGALDPQGDLVTQSLAFLEAGMPKGRGAYFGDLRKSGTADVNFAAVSQPDAERHYLWRHYVEYETMWPIGAPLFLARDDLPRFFEWLFHNLAAAIHRDFRVGVESLDGVPSCAPGDGERWLAIRKMFVHETGGYDGSEQSLWLLQAIPRSWLRPGNRLSVSDMGTWLGGQIDLSVEVAPDGNSVAATARLSKLAVRPKDMRMRLRSGDGRALAAATVNGSDVPVQPGDTIALPILTDGTLRVAGRFR
jgi:hypothetical protein